MKVVERGRIIVTRIGEGALIPLALIPFCMSLGISPGVYAGLFIAALICGFFRIRITGVVIGFGIAAGLVSCLTLIFEAISKNYEINGSLLTGAFLILGSGITYATRRLELQPHQNGDVLVWSGFSVLLSWMTWVAHSWNPSNALSILTKTDDRYSPWLAALARAVQDGNVEISGATNGNGGPSSNVVLITGRVLMNWVLQTSGFVRTDNALALLHISIGAVLVITVVWVLISGLFVANKSPIVRSAYGLSIALFTYSLGIGFVRVGHFAALCGLLFISLAVLAHLAVPNLGAKMRYVQSSIVLTLLAAAGMAWLPLTLVAILYALFTAVQVMTEKKILTLEKGVTQVFKSILAASLFSVVTGAFLWKSSVLENVVLASLRSQSEVLPGGPRAIQTFLLIMSFACLIWFAVRQEKTEPYRGHTILISALLIPLVGLLLRSYFVSPFVPQIRDWSLVYITASVLIPLSILILVSGVGEVFSNKKSEILIGPAFVVLLFSLLTPTSTNLNWVSNLSNIETTWSNTVITELAGNPEMAVACLNTTKDDVVGDKDAYECTKMSFALGGFDSESHRLWESSTGCLVEPTEVVGLLAENFQTSLTVLLTDPSRTSSYAGCQAASDAFQNGWLTDLDWQSIRTMSQSGIVVTIPTTRSGQ